MVSAYYEVAINPAHSGFGMYQRGEDNYSPQTAWADNGDLLKEIDGDFRLLEDALNDEDFIKSGVEDVRGKIYGGDPEDVYAMLIDGDVVYFGIEATEVAEDFWG